MFRSVNHFHLSITIYESYSPNSFVIAYVMSFKLTNLSNNFDEIVLKFDQLEKTDANEKF